MKFATFPRFQRPMLQTSTTNHKIPAPATRNASFQTLFKSTTPANVFATLTNSCACHVFCNVSKSLRLPRETYFEPQKTSRDRQFLTILTSKSLSRAGVVQILRSSTSKSAPNMQRGAFFRKNRSRAQAWCKFCRCQLPKVLRTHGVLTILTSESLSRAGVVQIWSMSTSKSAPDLPVFNDFDFQIALARRRGTNFVDILGSRSSATTVFRTYLCEPSKPRNYRKTQRFAQFLPAKTSMCDNTDAARATGNFQYSRKLELLNFL